MRNSIALILLLTLSAGAFAANDRVKTISNGAAIDINKHRVPGKYTVVEFYADW